MTPSEAYRTRAEAADAALAGLDRTGAWLANFRGGTFLAAVAAGAVTVAGRLPRLEGWSLVVALLAAYVFLAQWHQRVITEEGRQRLKGELNRRGLGRLDGGWRAFAGRGERFARPDHPYLPDLDLFGQGSVFQLMDESGTATGEERLAAWLSSPAAPAVVAQRQEAVRELQGQLDFRQELVVETRLAAKGKANPDKFIAWAEGGWPLASVAWARPLAWALPLGFAAAATLASLEWISPRWAWGGFFALLAVTAATWRPLAAAYEALSSGEGGFVRFENAFAVVARQPFRSAPLLAAQARLSTGDVMAVDALRAFSRRFGFAELRQSSQLHALIQLFTLWDIHVLFALERWRRVHGPRIRGWFDALAELEALSSLAGYAHARPDHCFPQVRDGAAVFEAQGLGHPLLDTPVRNDVTMGPRPSAWIVTGSNMSGKTTLLRAVGVNAVLALAGAPVSANGLSLSDVRVLTGMRVKDSLERGVSYFHAEVQRLRALLDGAREAKGKALFLLDEILLGTNIRERQIASGEILRLFLETGAVGAVATHDLTLTSLAATDARVRNVHFEDQVVDGRMDFDYRLREGVVQSTNALKVLQQAGIDVRES